MTGHVDEYKRAVLSLQVRHRLKGRTTDVTAWVDTAFDGHLVMTREQIKDLELSPLAETDAILADGSTVTLEAFVCFAEWFGQPRALQVIANEGGYPLLGIGLLEERVLHIDYRLKTVTLE